MAIADVIQMIRTSGIMEFYLPFVLMFSVFYGLLNKSKLFGDPDNDQTARNINLIVAFVAAMFVMVSTMAVARFLEDFFTRVIVLIMGIIAFMLVLFTMLPSDALKHLASEEWMKKWFTPLLIAAALLVAAIFLAAGGLSIFGIDFVSPGAPAIGLPSINLTSEDWALIIMAVLFIGLVVVLTREPKSKDPNASQ